MKPFTPEQVLKQQEESLPDFVIEAVNALLVKEATWGGRATFRQNDVIEAILRVAPEGTTRQVLFANRWLDFEPAYRKSGWDVDYDRPGYNESYEPTYTFSKNN